MPLPLWRSARSRQSARSGAVSLPHVAIPATDAPAAGQAPWRVVDVDHAGATGPAPAEADAPEVDIWIVPAASMARHALTRPDLSAEELAHARSLKRDGDRIRYMAVRSLLRAALSHAAETTLASGGWDLTTNAFGKPELPAEHGSLSFSITHAGAFSVIAVARGATIGIDAEKVEAARLKHLPFDCFSTREQRHLRKAPEGRRHIDFFRLWTLKEAYTKALGLGFSAEFDRIQFALDPVRLDRKAPQAGRDDTESFDLVSIDFAGETYFLATCLLNATHPGAARTNVFVVGA